ncbi:MAG TPA: VOC family protein [Nitrospirae bacterium]|nr:VOC family protein [Nitrospirota bacterium]HDZ88788.1 VOC family protein [Nitrospirota bacterium]
MPSEPQEIISHIDHLVLTVRNIETTCNFYAKALGMKIIESGGGRKALAFGNQKINLHELGKEFEPKASAPTPGSSDVCLITQIPIHKLVDHLDEMGVNIVEGPVKRTGAIGVITSIYFHDIDGNLVEISNYA